MAMPARPSPRSARGRGHAFVPGLVGLGLVVLAVSSCAPSTDDTVPRGGSATSTPAPTREPASAAGTVGGPPVRYASGVAVAVPSAQRFTPSSTAVGQKSVDVGVLVTVEVTNGSKSALTGTSVVVGVKAGGDFTDQIFDPAQDINTGLTGTIAPGKKSSAQYAFAVPSADVSKIEVNVNPNLPQLGIARFTGAVKS